ncbi:MAG: sigma-70 family RNA polymerase sigma factor [Steroidobacteraceae bacterium]
MSKLMTAPQPAAQRRANQAFERLAEPFRRELKVHCYRMLGSVHEAEDLVQETYLRAWRSFDRFDGEGSLRAWFYRIATNACLNALEHRHSERRLLPDQQGAATEAMPGAPAADVAWLEPYPDGELNGVADEAPNPEARYASHEAVQLAFVAAIQQLPPLQRAALLLCDVLGWSAAESAALLGGSTASINSALQRSRASLAQHYPGGRPRRSSVPDPAQQRLLARYLKAWEGHDLESFVALLKEDAAVTMPPWPQWYVGREAARSVFGMLWKTCGGLRLVPTAANSQPAFAVYERGRNGSWAAHSIHVLTLEPDTQDTAGTADGAATIATLTLFVDPRLFPAFALPMILDSPVGS